MRTFFNNESLLFLCILFCKYMQNSRILCLLYGQFTFLTFLILFYLTLSELADICSHLYWSVIEIQHKHESCKAQGEVLKRIFCTIYKQNLKYECEQTHTPKHTHTFVQNLLKYIVLTLSTELYSILSF